MEQSLFYNNNQTLKKAGIQEEFTDHHVQELTRCFQDISYFVRNYVYIVSLDEGRMLFNLYDYEKEMIDIFHNNRFVCVRAGRQLGKTISVAAYLLWCIIFNKDYVVAILANKAAKAQEILSRIKLMYEELPFWMKPGVKKWNEQSVHFSNGSLLFSSATSESSIRGFSVNLVYIDEMAFIPNDVQFYTATYPVIASGKTSKIILTSTPNGLNLFYKIYTDAVNKRNNYAYYDCLWYKHPNRDEAWKKETIRNTSEHQFRHRTRM